MHLKALVLKGFKSFPDRTRLDFGPGVSVVVGPNGSGKSNVTDAVLWAMGEQSPLAVRGQSMQDVIFGGGRGVQPRGAAEVEIVLDNSDATVPLPLSEISIVRRLERNGEGGYRLNGARCRLADVIEVLSDTGLGKESHSVISQGKVDAIVTSKPRERRLLIEEAAGLGKHRKRRRRAQLKLERTQENLDRALDIEREARTRVRPLKRQAEAAELHERLERQILQARLELARDEARSRGRELRDAERAVAGARGERDAVEARLQETIERRGAAERALAERAERHDARARRAYAARSALERLQLRGEQAQGLAQTLRRRGERVEAELRELGEAGAGDQPAGERDADGGRVQALEAQLAQLHAGRERELERETAELAQELERQRELLARAEAELGGAREQRERAAERVTRERDAVATTERAAQQARREAERIGAELAAANQFLRAHARFGADGERAAKTLGEELRVQDGYELALAAALAGRLDAALADDVAAAQSLLDTAGPDGGTALLARADGGAQEPAPGPAPAPGARRLLDLVGGSAQALATARRLLADAWVVERLQDLPADFGGIAVTRSGRVWFAAFDEIRQLAAGGGERVLARLGERDRLLAASERAATAEGEARAASEQALERLHAAEEARAGADAAVRERDRERLEAEERARRGEWLIEQRRQAPAGGALAVQIAEIEGELAAERRQADQRAAQLRARLARIAELSAQRAADARLLPLAERLAKALGDAGEAVRARLEALEGELAQDRAEGERMAGELSACAARESQIQAELRAAGEQVTGVEVAAQRLRDSCAEAELELRTIADRLGIDLAQAAAGDRADRALGEEELADLHGRVERLQRRREQLGPVNPLAQEEYAEALAHVEELERQREDLEEALRELRGVIRETDRQIEQTFAETFAAAAANFEELVGDVFPGGSGRLTLVAEERLPSPVLGGQAPSAEGDAGEDALEQAAEAEAEAELADAEERELPGVEIEVTPAGKATKRLSLLSGGEKSMTALAFLFAVFLARPCPFYILDEVEAALDDLNLDRFLALLRRYSERAQFIVITHQKRTMEAADWLYGVSMGSDGVSKVLSRRLPADGASSPGEAPGEAARVA